MPPIRQDRARIEEENRMKIKNYQDFYAGLMFVCFGTVAMYLSRSYNIGTAADMGPGFFPFYLGGLLATLGALVLFKGLGATADTSGKVSLKPLIVFISMIVFSVITTFFGLTPRASLSVGIVAGCIFAFLIGLRTMGLVLVAVTLFGLLVKGLGLVVCVTLLIVIASLASHEVKAKEVVASVIFLCLLGIGVFIYGLNLQMPIWPDMLELQNMFRPAEPR
jgi:hypothetical protein